MKAYIQTSALETAEAQLAECRRDLKYATDRIRAARAAVLKARKRLGLQYPSSAAAVRAMPRGRVFSAREISDSTGGNYSSASGYCCALTRRGKLERVARGRYRKPG